MKITMYFVEITIDFEGLIIKIFQNVWLCLISKLAIFLAPVEPTVCRKKQAFHFLSSSEANYS